MRGVVCRGTVRKGRGRSHETSERSSGSIGRAREKAITYEGSAWSERYMFERAGRFGGYHRHQDCYYQIAM